VAGTDPLGIIARIGGRSVGRDEVLGWEARRTARVSAKLGLRPASAGVSEERYRLLERKLALGREKLERRLARELRVSAPSARVLLALSGGRRRFCAIELSGASGSGEAMPGHYRDAMETGDEAALLRACPDHYVLSRDAGAELVIETTGGSPLAARIFLDEADTGSVRTPADEAFPTQWAAVGRAARGGPVSGAIRHQFRDEADGFAAILTGEFPAAMPGWMVRAHEWHLACEFSNWVEAANGLA